VAAIDAWWRTCNYLTVGQIYLKHNPLLEGALSAENIKPVEELFDSDRVPGELVRKANPPAELRMSASPHANGGLISRPLDLPNFGDFAVSRST
jgi:phosphoketolase